MATLTIPDWVIQGIGNSPSLTQSPLIGAAAGPPPIPPVGTYTPPQGNNAGRGLGNFAGSLQNGSATQPLNPQAAPRQGLIPSLNQALFGPPNNLMNKTPQGFIPRLTASFGPNGSLSGIGNLASGLGSGLNSAATGLGSGLSDLGSGIGGALSDLF